ncbi:hypothetical protein WDW89_25940 [Deltaproteobacteria bacterium TL4]
MKVDHVFLKVGVFGFLILFSGCQQDTDSRENLAKSDLIQDRVQVVGFNLNEKSLVKGAYKISLTQKKSFDSNYWDWNEMGFEGAATIPFLENKNQTISLIQYLEAPSQDELSYQGLYVINSSPNYAYLENPLFADGSVSNKLSRFKGVRPKPITERIITPQDKDGIEVPDKHVTTWSHEYDVTTGLPSKSTKEVKILSSENVVEDQFIEKHDYTYAVDPFGENFYQNSHVFYSQGSLEPTFTFTEQRMRADNSTLVMDTRDYACKNANGDISDSCDQGFARKTEITLTDKKTDEIVINKALYSGKNNSTEYFREVTEERYHSLSSGLLKKKTKWIFSKLSDSSTSTIISTYKYNDKGQLLQETTSNNSVFQQKDTIYDNDDQGRSKAVNIYNENAQLIYSVSYTFDDLHRKTSRDVKATLTSVICSDETIQEKSVSLAGGKTEYEYGDSGTHKIFTKTLYNCINGGVANNPSTRFVFTYNALGQRIQKQTYLFNEKRESLVLSQQTDFEYNTDGTLAKTQYYLIDNEGNPTPANYVGYEYDVNLFRSATKYYDIENNLCNGPSVNKAGSCGVLCSSSSFCYALYNYTYR